MVIEIEKGAKKEDASKANDAIPGLPRDPGIYYKSSQAARTQLKEVEAAKTEMQRGFATLVTGIGSLKLKREAAGPGSPEARAPERTQHHAGCRSTGIESRDSGRNGRHDAFAHQLLHE